MDISQEALAAHKRLRGKLSVELKEPLEKREDLSLYYTPGVGAVSSYVAEHPDEAREYTGLNNSVAIVSDGSAVLGLGNIGPLGALPVMEGKALLFKRFGGIDGYPIVLSTQDPDEIIAAVKAIAPSFGGINLEDIAAPQCFYIEDRLKEELNIPVMHDDQHGTAIVVLAGLINAFKVKGASSLASSRIVIAGAGAAGVAIAKLLNAYGANNILMIDSKGIVGPARTDLTDVKNELLPFNKDGLDGSLEDALKNADIFIGVSKAGLLTKEMVQTMAPEPFIFAMANPVPEIMPEAAKEAGALVVATGRSDFPNQINNVLAFPGIFRGALDNNVTKITTEHKIAAAEAIARLVENPTADLVIPPVFDDRISSVVAQAIA